MEDYEKTAEAILRAMVAAMEEAPPPPKKDTQSFEQVCARLAQPGGLKARLRGRAQARGEQEQRESGEGEDSGGSAAYRPRASRQTC
ncbi:MAG: hypothetical protein KBF48_01285 [Xanthomonadales bacterium]|nr:hypothetical protein [Xanthomonadales bacterium]